MMRIKEEESRIKEVRPQKWQGKLIETRWDDADVTGCFSWLCCWKTAPTPKWQEFTNYTNSYSPLRFTNSTRQRQATTQTSSAACAEKLWRASLMFRVDVAY